MEEHIVGGIPNGTHVPITAKFPLGEKIL